MELKVNGEEYFIKPYSCSPNTEFPFYINITNICNAKCKFCSNELNNNNGKLNLLELKSVLDEIHTKVSRFSISGGETLLFKDDLKSLLELLAKYNRRITLNTNGSLLKETLDLLNCYPIESIQLSRHHYIDEKNNEVFGIKTISYEEIKALEPKADLRINCLLIENYIDSPEEIVKFLEHISETNISQVGFISMMQVNPFAKENFIDYKKIVRDLEDDLQITDKLSDGDRCMCNNAIYVAKNGKSIFVYFRNTKNYQECGRSLFFDSKGLRLGY